ncbi:DEAD/DEAH box helicase [Bacteriovorax sp. PP10]|uniref:DEAD/DEAH box helicase n=1 Tax=Bacteriovorax antarcticus TaxID=3088717 RepID=A0ABU5W281_9BACT|nr:DEAD/DEAH box helicase [Bacteriovorax sp. PP10]MEA9358340.1 DEAD/DEAH box helicase [Bacteriovorax sp. PP10]
MIQFPEAIQKALTEMKIQNLTPIQEQAIPVIMEGKDLIALSETGSGKTLAFTLPLVASLIGAPKRPTKVLIITPTKELSEQILGVAKKCARFTTIISTSIYGGNSFSEQERELKNGVHLIVACPGRLKDHIEKNTIDLSGIETVVLDEADQLMDMGFLPHLRVALEATKERKQTLLFSATMSEEVKLLTEEFLTGATLVEFQANKAKAIVTEAFCPITDELRYPFIRFLLKHHKIKACLIFTRTKDEARSLNALLAEDKYKSAVLEGDMTTHQRKKALNGLKEKTINIMVATDIAARGLDIPHVTHIINLNPPLNAESYIHRLGRTARHDKGGMAITIYMPEEKEKIERILEDQGKTLKITKFKEFNYQLRIEKRHLRVIKNNTSLDRDDEDDAEEHGF